MGEIYRIAVILHAVNQDLTATDRLGRITANIARLQ